MPFIKKHKIKLYANSVPLNNIFSTTQLRYITYIEFPVNASAICFFIFWIRSSFSWSCWSFSWRSCWCLCSNWSKI